MVPINILGRRQRPRHSSSTSSLRARPAAARSARRRKLLGGPVGILLPRGAVQEVLNRTEGALVVLRSSLSGAKGTPTRPGVVGTLMRCPITALGPLILLTLGQHRVIPVGNRGIRTRVRRRTSLALCASLRRSGACVLTPFYTPLREEDRSCVTIRGGTATCSRLHVSTWPRRGLLPPFSSLPGALLGDKGRDLLSDLTFSDKRAGRRNRVDVRPVA